MDFLTNLITDKQEFEGLSDYFILRTYELIRDQVLADALAATRLLGIPAKDRADRILAEINRRGLFCKPIEWHLEARYESDNVR